MAQPHLYGLIAGEVSGDTLGAGLMKAILRHDPEAKFIGIGGPKMIAQGLDSPFKMEELSVMGIFEVLSHAVPILRIRSKITKLLLKERPLIFIGIDSPDFNLTVERRLKAAGIPTVHYVSPSVWAWREGRMEKIKRSCDEVLALLPFEKDFYDRHDMPCTYVGHTLAAQIPLEIDQNLARERCGLYKNCVEVIEGKVLAVLPGSRRGIIKRMLPLYAKTARLLREKIKDLTFISVAPNHDIAVLIKDIWLEHAPEISLTVFVGKGQDVIASADVCLLTCGTIAFETMLKLQETNYVKMKGYAVSDFWHGPLAQVDEGTFVILYAPEGPVFENCKEMLAKLDEIGAEVVLVSDNEDIVAGRPFSFLVPKLGCDCVSPFLFAVFAQMFACKLTTVKGRNPDAPRNLNKVTITK